VLQTKKKKKKKQQQRQVRDLLRDHIYIVHQT